MNSNLQTISHLLMGVGVTLFLIGGIAAYLGASSAPLSITWWVMIGGWSIGVVGATLYAYLFFVGLKTGLNKERTNTDYLDFLVRPSFKKTKDGRTLFFPYGIGTGYILSKESEAKIKKSIKNHFLLALPIAFLAVLVSDSAVSLYALMLLSIVAASSYSMRMRKMLRTEQKANERFGLDDFVRNTAHAMGKPLCILMLTMNCVITGALNLRHF